MRLQIELRDQRQIGGADRLGECFLVASALVGYGLEVNPHAMRADDLRSMLKAQIKRVRSRGLIDIESLRRHPISNSELLIFSRNAAGEERPCKNGGANNGLG